MPDTSSSAYVLPPRVDAWLLPLEGEDPCGPNLEYDPESLELEDVSGKPESQFGPAEPADWARVREIAESLFGKTRDLRLAMWWGRAAVNLEGFSAVPATLALLVGLLDRFWEPLHPLPDEDEPSALARLSVLGGLNKLDSLLGDVRNCKLAGEGRLQGLRVRDVEVALSKLAARSDETARSQGEIAALLSNDQDIAVALHGQVDAASASLQQIQLLMSQRFSADLSVDLAAFKLMLASVKSVLPVVVAAPAEGDSAAVGTGGLPATQGVAQVLQSIQTRQEATRAIELVCTYLERHEPTNPAQFLLRRAARVIDKNFLELVSELAPDSVKDVARIMGVDPSTLNNNQN
jgi:type VI secretion system protein ImpA